MSKRISSGIDRRSVNDRREAHNLDYFLNGGVERRTWEEQRSEAERRTGWIRAGKWYSVFPWEI